MKKVHVMLVLLVFLQPLLGHAGTKVDSLKQLLQSEVPIDRAEVLWSIAYELFDVDNPQAVFYAERAYHEVWKRGDSLQIVKVGTTYGQLLRRVGKLEKSIDVSTRLLRTSKSNHFGKYTKMLLNSLGLAFNFQERFDKALECQYESLELRRKDRDPSEVAIALLNIGHLHYRLNDNQLSINYSKQSFDMFISVGDSSHLPQLYVNLGAAYQEDNQLELAINNYRKALSLKSTTADYIEAGSFYGLGSSFYSLGLADSAKYYALKALYASERYADRWFESYALILLSEIEIDAGRLIKARVYLDSLESAITDYPSVRVKLKRVRYKYLSGIGDFEGAFHETLQYIALRDSVYSDEVTNRVQGAQLDFHQRENEGRIQLQSKLLELQGESIEKQRTVLVLIIVLLILLSILAVALFKLNARKSWINSI